MDPVKRHYGIFRGVVKDNKDPQKQRRIKISVPQTTGTEITEWAWPVEPSSIHTDLPVVGQGVWVQYIGGDPDYPVWLGAFGKNQGKNKQVFIKPLDNVVSLTGLTPYLIVVPQPDGTQELDLVASLLAMANKLKSIESQLATLHSTLATRTRPSHTHGSNG
jgi:hypothetical protein